MLISERSCKQVFSVGATLPYFISELSIVLTYKQESFMGYGVVKPLLITRTRDHLGKLKFAQLVKKIFVLMKSKGLITIVTTIFTNKCSRKISLQKELKTFLCLLDRAST